MQVSVTEAVDSRVGKGWAERETERAGTRLTANKHPCSAGFASLRLVSLSPLRPVCSAHGLVLGMAGSLQQAGHPRFPPNSHLMMGLYRLNTPPSSLFLKKYFIDYAITVIPFLPFISLHPAHPSPTFPPPLVHVHGSYT